MPTTHSRFAITRAPSPSLANCELTYLDRAPIDITLAARQHEAYRDALASLGVTVICLPADPTLPDSVFVEDCAVVLDEIAIIGRSGVSSRLLEASVVADALAPHRTLAHITAPGTLEGGDVLRIGRTLYVGRGGRSNESGIAQLSAIVARLGYEVVPVAFTGCLHLKTACSYLGRETMLFNPDWVDPRAFPGMNYLAVDTREPMSANALAIGESILVAAEAEVTSAVLRSAGFDVRPIDISEFQKAEAGLTCLSILF